MKKNKYNMPRHATNSNNVIYNQYVEDMFYSDEYPHYDRRSDEKNLPIWKKNGRYDRYHAEYDNTDMHMDPHTVAQHYIDRTSRPHG